LIEKNPCTGVKKAKENKSRDRYLGEAEYVRFIKVLNTMLDNPQAQAIFLLIALGLRKSEILSLKYSDLSLPDKHVYIRDPKNGEARYVALNSAALRLLTEMAKSRDKSSDWVFPSRSAKGHLLDVRKTFSTICKRATISGLRLHDLRRSHATHLLNSGVDVMTIKELLGHKSLKSTQVYARVATSSLAKSSELAAVKIQEAINQ
jgi:integrase